MNWPELVYQQCCLGKRRALAVLKSTLAKQ